MDNLADSLGDYIKEVGDEVNKRMSGDTPSLSPDDSFTCLFTTSKPDKTDSSFSNTESQIVSYGMTMLQALHAHLTTISSLFANEKLDKSLDIGIIVKLPEDLAKKHGSSEITIRMGEDLGDMAPDRKNEFFDSLLTMNIDKMLIDLME